MFSDRDLKLPRKLKYYDKPLLDVPLPMDPVKCEKFKTQELVNTVSWAMLDCFFAVCSWILTTLMSVVDKC